MHSLKSPRLLPTLLMLLCAHAASAADDAAHYGGTMRLLGVSSEGTLDPHINYTARYWMLYNYSYDGLMAFKKAAGEEGTQLVPDLAEAMPEVSADGLRYRFKLRQGIAFSNGKVLTVDDVKASLQRIFKVLSPTSGSFYNGIVGADKCLDEPASCTLEGGVMVDADTHSITINLTQPDAEFLYKLAVPHAAILPADTPADVMDRVAAAAQNVLQDADVRSALPRLSAQPGTLTREAFAAQVLAEFDSIAALIKGTGIQTN